MPDIEINGMTVKLKSMEEVFFVLDRYVKRVHAVNVKPKAVACHKAAPRAVATKPSGDGKTQKRPRKRPRGPSAAPSEATDLAAAIRAARINGVAPPALPHWQKGRKPGWRVRLERLHKAAARRHAAGSLLAPLKPTQRDLALEALFAMREPASARTVHAWIQQNRQTSTLSLQQVHRTVSSLRHTNEVTATKTGDGITVYSALTRA